MTRANSRWIAFVLFGLLARAAHAQEDCDKLFPDLTCDRSGRFAGFEKPIVQPYLFEDPFITTGLYPYYVWHQFPESSALEGGEAHVAAAQIRVAVTDRLAIIATKDGYMWKRPDNPLLRHTGGWMNLAFGAKYAFYQDRDAGRIASFVKAALVRPKTRHKTKPTRGSVRRRLKAKTVRSETKKNRQLRDDE